MGTGYTRNDTVNNIADGNIINASDLDGEFDAVQAAFDAATGHTHDGTTGEGAPIEVTGPAQEYVSTGTEFRPKANNTYDLGSSGNQWKDLYVDGTANLDAVDIDGGNIDGTVIGAASAAAGTFTTATATTGNITTVNATTVDTTNIEVTNIKAKDGTAAGSIADATGVVTLASSVLTTTDINGGTIDGTVIGGASAAAGTFTNVTASGTINLAGATVSNGGTVTTVDINGGTIDGTVIGGSTPAAISGTTGAFSSSGFPVVINSTNNNLFKLALQDTAATVGYIGASSAAAFAVGSSAAAELFRVSSTGLVGIGTSSPTDGKLVITGASVTTAQGIRLTGDAAEARFICESATIGAGILGTFSNHSQLFYTNSTERMRIDSTGDVGIGTTSPIASLSVQRVSAASSLSLRHTASGNGYGYLVATTGTTTNDLVISSEFNGSATERMRITSTGDVGIGLTNPGVPLHVKGQTNGNVMIVDATGTAANYIFDVRDDGTSVMRVDPSGNLLVGGTTAGNAGTVSINVGNAGATAGGLQMWAGTAQTSFVQFGDESGTAANHYRGYMAYAHGSDSMQFGTASTERMRIDASGNVGIGLTPSTYRLDVLTEGNNGIRVNAGTGGADQLYLGNTGGVPAVGTLTSDPITVVTNGTERVRIDTSGNVGIGTSSPNRRLEVTDSGSGEITLSRQMGIDGADLHWLETSVSPTNNLVTFKSTGSSNGGFTFNNASSEFMRITSTGNVGIGTSSPGSTLTIQGSSGNSAITYVAPDATVKGYVGVTAAGNYIAGAAAGETFIRSDGVGIAFSANTGASVQMRLDPSGNLLVGKTSASATLDVKTASNQQVARISLDAASSTSTPAVVIAKKDNDSTTSQVFVQFLINSEGAGSGQINANGGNSAAFGSYSDERLKENIVDLPAQLENICSLRPVEFDYKAGGHQIGFIAQEMQAVYPDVVGSGSDDMLTITGWSKTEARLVKALQEAVQKIEALEARITALEGTSA